MATILQYLSQDFRIQRQKDEETHVTTRNDQSTRTTASCYENINELLTPKQHIAAATTAEHVARAQLHRSEQQQRTQQWRHAAQQLTSVADNALHYATAARQDNASVSCCRSNAASTLVSFPSFVSCASTAVAYNINPTAYTDAATLELKRKTPLNKKLLHVGSSLDSRSFFYLTLLVLIYCCVLIRASAAAAANASTAVAKFELQRQQRIEESVVHLTSSNNLPQVVDTVAMSQAILNISVVVATSQNTDAISTASALPAAVAASPNSKPMHRRGLSKRDAANVPDDEDDSSYDEFDEYDALINNKSAKGKYIGAPCNNMTCEPSLLHVACDKETLTCGCERNYPVQLGLIKGCDKPKKLGEQCFYDETCMYNDENSLCVQVRHNAMCQCASGFHSVSYTKPTRRVFCTQDLKELTSDLPTLLGVTTGIAVLAGLICMVLHLFSKTKYPRHRNFGDANLPPPIMYSSDTGIPLTVHSGRPSSRSSLRSSGSIGSYGNRRSSSGGAGPAGGGSKGILVSTSRTGSRRPSLASVHSTSSSVRSYSMMRFEKEAQQKEIRQEMKLRLARLQQQTHLTQNKPQIIIGDTLLHHSLGMSIGGSGTSGVLSRITMATPSPLTPNSMDELLPVVEETQEYTTKPEIAFSRASGSVAVATLNAIRNVATISATTSAASTSFSVAAATITLPQLAEAAAYIGPCSSSTEALD